MNKLPINFIFLILILVLSNMLNAKVGGEHYIGSNCEEMNAEAEESGTLIKEGIGKKIDRRLKLGEKIALKFAKKKRKKTKKRSHSKSHKETNAKVFSIAGFVLGISSWFFAGIILGAIAIIISSIAIRTIRRNPALRKFGFFAVAGLVFGLIGVAGWIIGQLTLAAY